MGEATNVNEEDIEKYNLQNNGDHYCNLITPLPEIIQRRIEELSPYYFQLEHLSPDQRSVLINLLCSRAQVFSKSLATLGHTDLVTPHIELLNSHPITSLSFPVPLALEAEAQSQIREKLEADIILRSNSAWTCPMLLVKKKSIDPNKPPKYRLALDLRLLNAIIVPSSYPLPKIQNILLNLSKFKYFSTLDMGSAYWQIAAPKEIQEKLSLTTPWDVFTYQRLVFGLRTAASTFQQMIDLLVHQSGVDGCFP